MGRGPRDGLNRPFGATRLAPPPTKPAHPSEIARGAYRPGASHVSPYVSRARRGREGPAPVTTLDMTDTEPRVVALRSAVGELLAGYSEVARLLSEADPETREALLAPLRRAADNAAAVLASS